MLSGTTPRSTKVGSKQILPERTQFDQRKDGLPGWRQSVGFCQNEPNLLATTSKHKAGAEFRSAQIEKLRRVSFLPERTQFFQRPFSSYWTVRTELWSPRMVICVPMNSKNQEQEISLFPARSFLRSSDEYRSRQSLAWVNED
jgi:hypothetical protein